MTKKRIVRKINKPKKLTLNAKRQRKFKSRSRDGTTDHLKKHTCYAEFLNKKNEIESCLRQTCSNTKHCFSHQLKTYVDAERNGTYEIPNNDQISNSKLILKYSTKDGAGYGVFTNKKTCFRSGDYITKFEGNTIEDFNAKNNINRKYCLEIRKSYIVEGIAEPEVNKGLGSFINSHGNFSDTNNENLENNKTIRNKYNTTFYYDNKKKCTYIKAIEFIRPNTELFVAYGTGYNRKQK